MTEEEEMLARLVGRELSSVTFVRGYLQLHFDGPFLNAITPPSLFTEGARLDDTTPGFKDQLVRLVGTAVVDTKFKRDVELVLAFANGTIVRVPLAKESRRFPGEAVVFDSDDRVRGGFVA